MDPHFVEDRTVEVLSALTFLVAGCLTPVAISHLAGARRTAVLAVGFICFLAFLDEMSFGQRLFDLNAPEIFGVQFDALHDVTSVVQVTMGSEIALALLLMVCAAGVAGLMLVRRQSADGDPQHHRLPWTLIYLAIFSVAVAQTLDMYIGPLRHPVVKASGAEELLELTAAFLCLGFMVQVTKSRSAKGD